MNTLDTGDYHREDETVFLLLCNTAGEAIKNTEGKSVVVQLNQSNDWRSEFSVTLMHDGALDLSQYAIAEVFGAEWKSGHGMQEATVINDLKNRSRYYQSNNLANNHGIVMIGDHGYVVDSAAKEDASIAANHNTYTISDTGDYGTEKYMLNGVLLMIDKALRGCIERPRKVGDASARWSR